LAIIVIGIIQKRVINSSVVYNDSANNANLIVVLLLLNCEYFPPVILIRAY
jgi:hypothetical protein